MAEGRAPPRGQARPCHRHEGDGLGGSVTTVDVAIFPSFPLLETVVSALAASGIGVGGQDIHPEVKGAFTGDVSAAQLRDVGASFALCGHSERRQYHGESDELVARKARAAAAAGLAPVVCVGETREQRRQHPQRESRLWRDTVQALPAAPAGRRWVDVADCAADITEFIDYEDEQERFYVVRSQHNRTVTVQQQACRPRRKLWEVARALPVGAEVREVRVAAQEGQPARTAHVTVAWAAVTIVPPRQRRGQAW